ncbi:NYN domain-containing protein [Candidatus Omnitrophota bacterium]
MPRYLIIDGYNAMHKIKELEDKKDISLEAARLYFIKMLQEFMARKSMFDKVSLVFDSKDDYALGVRKHLYGKVEVLFATKDRDADSVIVEILRNAPDKAKISVSSDDNFVKNHTRAYGKDIVPISKLREIIMLKKKTHESKIKEQEVTGKKFDQINEELKKYWGLN